VLEMAQHIHLGFLILAHGGEVSAQLLAQAWSEVHGAQGVASASRPAKPQEASIPASATASASAHRSPAHHPDLSAAA